MTDTMNDAKALGLVRWLLNGSDATPPPPDVTLEQAYNHIAARLAQQPAAALPEVTELARAVDFADKCKAALNAHLQDIPSMKGSHLEAWCATRNQLWRCSDDADRKQASALESYRARLMAKAGGDRG